MLAKPFQPFCELPEAFSIGLKPVDPKHFLHIDDELLSYLEQKRALYREQFDDVFKAEPETLNAQTEAATLIYAAADINPPHTSLPPLAECALHVADDLVLLQRDESGWRLVAGSLCFPSSWTFSEKFGHPLEHSHAPVPDPDGKMDTRLRRIFDALRPDMPLWRENWSLDADNELRHDRLERDRTGRHKLDAIESGDIWLRIEYQTLHKLPESGAILFTIKIMVRRLADIAKQSNGNAILSALREQYIAMGVPGRTYKGINDGRDRLLAAIDQYTVPELQNG